MTEARYSQDIEEDRLFWEVVPHYNDAQETIVKAIKEEFSSSEKSEIKMLEIGCGTGLTSQKILKADPRIVLTAIDNVEYIAEQTMKRFAEQGETRLNILSADALQYLKQQPENSYDAILSALVLHNCPDEYRDQVFAEVFRTLKKGGVFVNVDKIAQDDAGEHEKALSWQLEEFKKFNGLGHPELNEKWTQHYLDDEKPGIVLFENEYENVLKSVGFSRIHHVYRYQMEASYVAKK